MMTSATHKWSVRQTWKDTHGPSSPVLKKIYILFYSSLIWLAPQGMWQGLRILTERPRRSWCLPGKDDLRSVENYTMRTNRSKTCGKQVPIDISPLHSLGSLWLLKGRPWQQRKSHSLLTSETQWPTSTLGEINHPLAVLLMIQPESSYFIAEDERDK